MKKLIFTFLLATAWLFPQADSTLMEIHTRSNTASTHYIIITDTDTIYYKLSLINLVNFLKTYFVELGDSTLFATVNDMNVGLATKQATLVSATNIKTVDGTSLLGSGDISIATDTTGFWAIVNNLVSNALSDSDTLLASAETLDSLTIDYWAGTLGADTTGYWSMIYAIVVAYPFDTTNVYAVTDSLASDIALKLTTSTYTAFIGTLTGGTTDQALVKTDGDDYDWYWGTIGSVAADTIPNQFTFSDVTGAALGSYHIKYIVVAGCDSARFYPATGDTIRPGLLGTKTISSKWLDVGDTLYTFCVASAVNSTTTTSIVNSAAGTPKDTLQVTTLADATPPAKATSFVAAGGTSQTQYNSTWSNPSERIDSVWFYEGSTADTVTGLVLVARMDSATSYLRTGRSAATTYWAAVRLKDASGNVSAFSNRDSATTTSGGATPFYTIDFEENNLDEWTTTSGANISTSSTQKIGDYSMRVGTNSFGRLDSTDSAFDSYDEIYVSFEVYLPSTSSQSAATNYISLFDDGASDKTAFGTNSTGSTWGEWIFGRYSGDLVDSNFTTNFSENIWHNITVMYKKGTGSNSEHKVWVDEDLVFSRTNGDRTDKADKFDLGSQSATITNYFYLDDVKFYTTKPF